MKPIRRPLGPIEYEFLTWSLFLLSITKLLLIPLAILALIYAWHAP